MRFVDSNIFIYHMAADPRHGRRAQEIVLRIEEGEETVTSTLVLQQVVSYLRWRRRADLIPAFLTLLQSLEALGKTETTFADVMSGAGLREPSGLPWGELDDLVIAAQMERLDIREIYSADRDFDRIPGVRRVF